MDWLPYVGAFVAGVVVYYIGYQNGMRLGIRIGETPKEDRWKLMYEDN